MRGVVVHTSINIGLVGYDTGVRNLKFASDESCTITRIRLGHRPPSSPRPDPRSRASRTTASGSPLAARTHPHSPRSCIRTRQQAARTWVREEQHARLNAVCRPDLAFVGHDHAVDAEQLLVQVVVKHIHDLLRLEGASDPVDLARECRVRNREWRLPDLKCAQA